MGSPGARKDVALRTQTGADTSVTPPQELQALSEAVGSVSRGVPQAIIDALPHAKYCSRFPSGEQLLDLPVSLVMLFLSWVIRTDMQKPQESRPAGTPLCALLCSSCTPSDRRVITARLPVVGLVSRHKDLQELRV